MMMPEIYLVHLEKMEQVYSWENNERPCDDFEWENPCEKNTDAPTGAETVDK